MYLGRGIEDAKGVRHALCGVFPFWTKLTNKLTLTYAEVRTVSESIFPNESSARGHIFHYSDITGELPESRSYVVDPSYGDVFEEGFRTRNVLASYVHLHFASNPSFAESFVASCTRS
jgi:cobyrinic acid a,c-diamide synthase